ncbi:hypothetical protein OCS_04336 [Ophiocordyceps sinensis CO18]|uniref:Uncharacterized protein n=1 Tax=Ophiocordyceps sinensis (strain Co18 / CGMCC 3.14243) TaxID=911162 RepID=T5A3C0_OPHSC|nr:hypothetical protein OCS_04336 [Ophiocordyceps sinensis CO18]
MDATNTGQRSLGECKNSTAWPGVAEQHVETEENGAGCMEPASTLTEPYLEAKPGWTRVKTKARASSTKVRHIMTRIGAIALRFRRKKKTTETQDQGERCELPRPRRQRTEAFKPCHGDWALVGCPQSKAEMASLVMAAQVVEIANRVLELPDHAFVAELDHFLKSVHTKVIPTKRGIDRHYHLDQVGIVGGYRLKTYERIWPILEKGAAMAGRKIDVQAAAFAQLAAHLQQTRRNPRVQIAAHGQPDLSDIADMTEPESFIALVGAPMVTADAKSPLKRAAQPHSPVRDKAARLSETKVELLPASTPRVEPSPIKSAPLAASFADTPAPRKLVAMSPETLAAGSSVRMAPGQAPSSPLRPNTATRVFRVPSDDDDSTLTPKTYTTTKTFQVSPDDDITLTPTVRTATGVFMAPSCDSSSSSSFGINTSHERADAQNGDHLVLVPKHNTFSNARRLPSDDESSLSLDANNSFGATPIPTGHRLALSINSSTPPQAFRVASGDNFGSGPEHAGAQTLPAQLSPVDSTRHVTLTPAGRHQSESTTPHTSVPMPSLRTPSPPREKLGLVDAIPSCTPRLLVTKPEGFDSSKRTSFDFGGTSPSFNALSLTSLSWVNSRRAVEAQEKHRRKSEPPLRPFFKSRVPAGLSTSPKKVRFHDGFVDTNSLSPGLLGSRPCEHEPANANTHQRPVSHTPETTITPSAALGGTATPAISWAQMTGRAASDAVGQSTPQTSNQVNDRKSVFSVDIRRNLNIFGGDEDTPSKQRYNAVALLAHIAEANCDGQAKVVVTQEHGRLFVRFKLPTKFAFMFPPDQGFNESRFTTTPSISSSPRIRVHGPSPSVQGGVPSPRHSPLQTPAVDSAHHDNIVMCDDFAPSPLGFHTDPASGHGEHVDQDVNDSFSLSIDATENFGYEDRSTTIPWDQVSGLRLDSQDDGATPFQPPQSDAMDRSDGSLTELMTPDVEMTPAPEYEGSPERMWTRSNVESGGQTADQEHGMTASFTQRPAPDQRLDREYKASIYHIHRQAADDDECDWDHEPRQEQDDAVRARDHDSPGRDYMRDFISRSKPKRLSATETGSPIAFSAKRQPLGAKDPNTESPLMGRRKTQAGEQQQAQSPFKRGAAPMLNHQSFVVDEDDEMEDGEPTKSARARENVATWHQSDEEMVDAPLARRSSRLLTLKRQMASKRSSTADPATVSKRSGSGRGHAPKAKSKRDASQQTRLNTRRNKGNAEYPAQLLGRQGLDEMDVDAPARHPRKTTKSSKCTKSVRWNEPLRSLQDESPKKMTIRDTQARAGVADRKKPKGTVRQMAKQLASVKEPPGRQGRITRAAARALE